MEDHDEEGNVQYDEEDEADVEDDMDMDMGIGSMQACVPLCLLSFPCLAHCNT